MRIGLWVVLGVALAGPLAAGAQVSVYAEFGASKLTDLTDTRYFYGPTVGASVQLLAGHHLTFGGDVRGSFLGGGNRLDQISVGPRITLPTKRVEPYAELLVGFARYNDGLGTAVSSSTDAEIQVVAGLDHRVTKHFDWRVFEFAYEQYYGLFGAYNPKTFSTGVVYHFGNRP